MDSLDSAQCPFVPLQLMMWKYCTLLLQSPALHLYCSLTAIYLSPCAARRLTAHGLSDLCWSNWACLKASLLAPIILGWIHSPHLQSAVAPNVALQLHSLPCPHTNEESCFSGIIRLDALADSLRSKYPQCVDDSKDFALPTHAYDGYRMHMRAFGCKVS